MSKNWNIRIVDALTAIKYIKEDTANLTYNDFLTNRVVRQATERNIELIGEALNSVPADIREKYQEVDWRNIIGMRNYLIHQYFSVVPDLVWEAANVHIYELEEYLMKILEN